MQNQTISPQTSFSQQTWAVLAAMLLIDSFHLIFGRLLAAYLSPFVSSFFVLAVATVEIALFLGLRRAINWQVLRQHLWFFLTIGFLVAAATVFSYTAVSLIDAGTASLLGRVSTVITLALSYFWLRESLTRQELLGAALCIIGAFTISFQPGEVFRLGSLFVLAGVTCYSLHIAVVKRYGDNIEFANFFLYRVGTTAVFLAIFMFASGKATLPPSLSVFLLLLLVGTVDVVISRILYYWALRQMRLGIHTIVLTMTPVLTILWSVLLFGERPSLQGLIGGALVLLGIVIVAIAQQRGRA